MTEADLILARIEASADLAAWRCPHCAATTETVAVTEGGVLPRALGVTHERGCPEWIDPR